MGELPILYPAILAISVENGLGYPAEPGGLG
jgi:hypothetical protein